MMRPPAFLHGLVGKLLFVGVLLALLIASPLRGESQGASMQSGEGYARIVNDVFVHNGFLQTVPGADGPVVMLTPAAQQNPDLLSFFRRSYLVEDVAPENAALWSIQNGRIIEIDERAHRVPLPNDDLRHWRGDLLFRTPGLGRRQISLIGDFGELIMDPPDYHAPGSDADRAFIRFNDGGGRLQDRAVVARFQTGTERGSGAQLLELTIWGNRPILTPMIEQNYAIAVDGIPIRPPQRQAYWPGSVVTIAANRGASARFGVRETVSAAPELSLYRLRGERQRAAHSETLVRAIERTMDRIVADTGGAGFEREPVNLTLDRDLQADLNAMVQEFSADHAEAWGDYTVGVTLMDAGTGEILALASSEHVTRDQEEATRNEPPAIDVNFRRLQIGSAAKPLISAAILAERPELGTLVINGVAAPDRALRQLLGVEFFQPNTLSTRTSGACDFNCFIQRSDNQYAAALMLLAAAPRGSPLVETGETYNLGGVVLHQRPLSSFETRQDGNRPVFLRTGAVAHLDWDHRLADLFHIDYEYHSADREGVNIEQCTDGQERLGDDRYDIGVWRNFFLYAEDVNFCHFADVSPVRENFLLDRQFEFQNRMLLAMIGGGEARWTNVKLAEAYARLVTGRQIFASLVRPKDESLVEAPGRFPLADAERRRITHALTLVARPGGTANAPTLREQLAQSQRALQAQGLRLGFFAKTGTPEIELPTYNSESQALNRLIRLHLLHLDNRGRLVLRFGADAMVPERGRERAIASRLRRDLAAVEAIAAARSTPARVAARLVQENEHPEMIPERFVVADRSILVQVEAPDRMIDVFGKSFAFVVGSYGPDARVSGDGLVDDGLARPRQAFVVVINIQNDVNDDTMVAVEFGATIFRHLLRPRLEAGTRRPAP